MLTRSSMRRMRRARRERGAVQIEFIMTSLLILLTIFAVIEVCMGVYTMSVLGDAAREGVRYAIVHGSNNRVGSGNSSNGKCGGVTCPDTTAANVVSVVQDYAKYSLHDTSAISVTVTYMDTTNEPPNRVKVEVSYAYVPWLTSFSPTLTTSAQGRIVN